MKDGWDEAYKWDQVRPILRIPEFQENFEDASSTNLKGSRKEEDESTEKTREKDENDMSLEEADGLLESMFRHAEDAVDAAKACAISQRLAQGSSYVGNEWWLIVEHGHGVFRHCNETAAACFKVAEGAVRLPLWSTQEVGRLLDAGANELTEERQALMEAVNHALGVAMEEQKMALAEAHNCSDAVSAIAQVIESLEKFAHLAQGAQVHTHPYLFIDSTKLLLTLIS